MEKTTWEESKEFIRKAVFIRPSSLEEAESMWHSVERILESEIQTTKNDIEVVFKDKTYRITGMTFDEWRNKISQTAKEEERERILEKIEDDLSYFLAVASCKECEGKMIQCGGCGGTKRPSNGSLPDVVERVLSTYKRKSHQ